MMVKLAYEIARKAHAGQKDKGGRDYIHHSESVAELVETEDEKTVAFLHDVVEDSAITLQDLSRLFPSHVVDAVDCLTKRPGEAYMAYLRRVCSNSLAVKVKIADMTHNSDLARIPAPSQKDRDRVEAYQKGIVYLQENLCTAEGSC